MVEFHKVISESEVRSSYLNLTDDRGRHYGAEFPKHLTKLAIVDGQGKITFAKKHGANQIWGTLRNWFLSNDIQPGTRILVRYDPKDTKDGCPAVHLVLESVGAVLPSTGVARDVDAEPVSVEIPISLERQIEDFVTGHLTLLEPGLKLYSNEDGREGRQYPTDVGIIDLLCQRPNGNLLVIELKRGKGSDVVVGQISRYIGWVKKYLAGDKLVLGMILTHDRDESLKYAVMANDKLTLRYFRLKLELVSEEELSNA